MSAEMIKTFVDNYAKADANLMQLRIACMCILGFTGFLRFDELINIVPAQIEISSCHLKIFIPRAKNDVYRDGNSVYINRINNEYCPVQILESSLRLAAIDTNSTLPLFRRLRFYKSSNTHKLCKDKLSYSRCREIFKNCLKELGYNPNLYGLHSQTSAVKHSKDMSERSLKIHGRWKSDTAKDMYTLDDVSQRLKITSNLGL